MDTHFFGTYGDLIEQAGKHHGNICLGTKIGTRMTMSGLRRIGINDPKGTDRQKLMVFVESDRCPTDAIMALTGCRPGKRSMKVRDYGKMAATFINLETNQAARVVIKANRQTGEDDNGEQIDFATFPEEELFAIAQVQVTLRPEDLPGKTLSRLPCDLCGENILDGREVRSGGRTLCLPCSLATDYYQIID